MSQKWTLPAALFELSHCRVHCLENMIVAICEQQGAKNPHGGFAAAKCPYVGMGLPSGKHVGLHLTKLACQAK